MPASLLDSAIYRNLLGDPELQKLFTDTAEIRAMLLVEGALAKVQGTLGLIPETSARFLHRASLDVQIDPAELAAATGKNGVPVPALISAARKALEAPEHAAWLHFGATSQDIVDTALILRLRQVVGLYQARLKETIQALGVLADAHAETRLIARTWGQEAVPTTFGAVVAGWGSPLLRYHERLLELKPRLLVVSLSGAAGTLSAMGPKGQEVRAALAEALDLADPGESWHATRDRISEFAAWCIGLCGSIGKMGEDVTIMASRGEIGLGEVGASSTMPQKQNPVAPSAMVALARFAVALGGAVHGAELHREARDGAAWMTEWLALPQICLATGRAILMAAEVARCAPVTEALRRPLDHGLKTWSAEAVSFALSEILPRPEAQQTVKALALEARNTGVPLPELVARDYPEINWESVLNEKAVLGQAPSLARRFAAAARQV